MQSILLLSEFSGNRKACRSVSSSQDTSYPIPDATSLHFLYRSSRQHIRAAFHRFFRTDVRPSIWPLRLWNTAWNEDNEQQPYAEYTIQADAPGYESVSVAGAEILPAVIALQNIRYASPEARSSPQEEVFVIPAHTLYGSYPAKIPESEIKPVTETGEIVLSRVRGSGIHRGPRRKSQEIPPPRTTMSATRTTSKMWPPARSTPPGPRRPSGQMSWPSCPFTLNRVYTEWYRNMGYDFTITSSTAFDHKWIPERNIYDTISVIADELFASYLSRPNVRQPLLTQYCDGRQVRCPGLDDPVGQQIPGRRGLPAPSRSCAPSTEKTCTSTLPQSISGIPASWPGYNLENGSTGEKVRQLQEEINVHPRRISRHTRQVAPDGIYGPATQAAVKKIQSVFGLPATGIVDYPTWYKISEIYVGVSRIAELD